MLLLSVVEHFPKYGYAHSVPHFSSHQLTKYALGNGVLTVTLPISEQTSPAHLVLKRVAPTQGMRKGNVGHPPSCVAT
jgi:hypothetical protein